LPDWLALQSQGHLSVRLEASLKLSNDRFFTRYQTLTYQRLTGRNGRSLAIVYSFKSVGFRG